MKQPIICFFFLPSPFFPSCFSRSSGLNERICVDLLFIVQPPSFSLVCRFFVCLSLSLFLFSLRLKCHFDDVDADVRVCVCVHDRRSLFFVLVAVVVVVVTVWWVFFFFPHFSFFSCLWAVLGSQPSSFFVSLCTYMSEDERLRYSNLCDGIRKKTCSFIFFCSLASCFFSYAHTHNNSRVHFHC